MHFKTANNIPLMKEHVGFKLLLTSFFLNAASSISQAPSWFTKTLWVVSAIASVLACLNQFYTFRKSAVNLMHISMIKKLRRNLNPLSFQKYFILKLSGL